VIIFLALIKIKELTKKLTLTKKSGASFLLRIELRSAAFFGKLFGRYHGSYTKLQNHDNESSYPIG